MAGAIPCRLQGVKLQNVFEHEAFDVFSGQKLENHEEPLNNHETHNSTM